MRLIVGSLCCFVGFVSGLTVPTSKPYVPPPIVIKTQCEPDRFMDAVIRSGWQCGPKRPPSRNYP